MLRTAVSLALASSALTLAAHPAAADTCSPARVMVVLDKSSSMVTGSINGVTKWDIAKGGLGTVLDQYQSKAEFGLMTFPQPNQCGPGALDVAPALANKTSIVNALGSAPPTSGNYTPMAQSLEAAANLAAMQTVTNAGPRHVVLITDGWQYCVPYDSTTRFDGTAAVEQLAAAGITTWIVGFGGEVDAAALNRMAVAANTAKAGCDPQSEDAAANNNCYFQADNAQELLAALNTIAGTATAEVCDGMDNDCDGQVDEDLTRGCTSDCGTGTETCHAGSWQGCDAPQPTAGLCDGEGDGTGSGTGSDQQPNGEGDTGMHAGCDCDASTGAPTAGSLAAFGLLGLAMFRRRRRA
jgi:MYXO-CTERM domain-containing protein